jgi:hypothetical protein
MSLNLICKTKPELEELVNFYVGEGIFFLEEYENVKFIDTF